MNDTPLLLASASPRRRELLSLTGLPFTVDAPDVDETCELPPREAVLEISRRKDNLPVRVTASMHDLVERASMQNFVPVVDDYGAFIGIITRKAIIKYCYDKLFPED